VGAGRRSIAPSRSKGTKGKTGGWVQLQRVPVISFSSNLLLAETEVDQTEHGRGAIGRSATWTSICFLPACSAPYSPLKVVSHVRVKSYCVLTLEIKITTRLLRRPDTDEY
jgi:hypothetical protein